MAVAVPAGWAGFATVGCAGVATVLMWPQRWFRRAAAGAALVALAWSVSALVGAA